jgi:hypothetical protein
LAGIGLAAVSIRIEPRIAVTLALRWMAARSVTWQPRG